MAVASAQVTVSNASATSIELDLQPAETLYGRAASGSPVIAVLKAGA